jgi:hypothetical protein
MCLPQPPSNPLPSREKHERRKKKHIEFDAGRMGPDPDFVDERKPPGTEQKELTLIERLFALFRSS